MFMSLFAGCLGVTDLNPFDGPPAPPPDDGWGPPDTGQEGVDEAPGAGFPFAEGKIFDLDLELPPSSVDALEREGPYVPATLRFAGYEVETGVRYKGSSTFDTLDGKPSFKMSFSAFRDGGTFLGVERLTLNSMRFDPTMLREAAAYRLFAQVGAPAPRHGFGRVTINGALYGLYSLVETLDENFLDRAFPGDGDGHLYDSTFIAADLTPLAKGSFELEEGDPATADAELDALVGALDSGNILDVIDTRFDRATLLPFLAVDLVSPNWDGYSRNTNNFLLYHAPLADRWHFVPWGQDTAFRGGGPLYAGVRGRVTTACLGEAACKAALEEASREVMATWTDEDLLGWTRNLSEIIAPACAEDPRKERECEPEDILDAVGGRPDEIAAELGP